MIRGRKPEPQRGEPLVRSMQFRMSETTHQRLHTIQGLVNATNPTNGPLNLCEVVKLAIDTLYKRLRTHRDGVRRVVNRLDGGEGRDGGNGTSNGPAETRLASDGEPAIDLNALVDDAGAAEANERKARGR